MSRIEVVRLLCFLVGALGCMASPDPLQAQTGAVTGVVTTTEGRPLQSAQVVIEGLQIGGLSNAQGRYLVQNVPVGQQRITIERIGFRPVTQTVEVRPGETAVADFQLEERAISMEGIVVTGVAAETPETQLPFTVERVDVDEITKIQTVNVAGLLQAKVPGAKVVQGSGAPGSEPSFQLRGPTSITGSQSPLVVIDGVITNGGIADIDPADVESMEVVKGAAAAALYGSRASAGVVQITTRSGANLADGQTQFTFRSSFQSNSIEHYPGVPFHHQWMMNADQTQILDRNGNPITFPRDGAPALNDGGNGRNAFTTFMVNPYPAELPLRDPMKQFFNPGNRITNYVAIGGNEGNTNYRLSFDYTNEEGAIQLAQGLEQFNARLNVGQRFGQFDIAAQAYFAKRDRGLFDEGGGGIIRGLTFTTAAADLTRIDPATGDVAHIGEPINQGNVTRNPLYDLLNTTNEESRVRGLGGLDVNWSPLTWLSFQANGSFDRIETDTHFYQRPGLLRPFNTPATGSISDANDVRLEMNASATAAMTFQVGEDLTVRSRLRYLLESLDESGFSVSGNNLPVANVERISLIGGTPTLDSYNRQVRSMGFFAISSFVYKDRYIFDVLGRRDGSSLFGAEERWQNYYRFSAAWRLSAEPWFNVDWLTELKPRYSIGTAGGRPSFNAQYQTYAVTAGAIAPRTLGNSQLKPELATEQEFGLDAVIAERFRIQANYVDTKVEDALLLVPLPSVAGFENQWRNGATIESNSRELALEASLIERSDLLWTARLNLDRTRTKITKLNVAPYRISDYRAGLYIREGETLGSYYGHKWPTSCAELAAGTDCGQFQVNDDGYLVYVGTGNSWTEGKSKNLWGTTGEVNGVNYSWGLPIGPLNSGYNPPDQKLGDSEPSLNASFLQNLEWKNFGFTVLFDSEFGAQVYNQTMQWRCRDGHCPMMDQTGKPDERQKPVTYYNALGFYSNNRNNSYFTEDADYIKLRELSVRYSLPESQLPAALQRLGISRATVNLTGRNLKTWTDYRGFDPEVGKNTFGGSAAVGRIDEYFYPNFRSVGLDLELVF
ncbi:MAG: SusC/RagA family TonB-linked outer membrane protein [Gemmatimonadetes bacterium]|nr:SusC/RagA family TonB-linked outer membrane protein [Gemmatimonadota bacterium]